MPENRPTLVITGATGFIGSRVASYFAGNDWNVIALVRKSPDKHLKNILYSKFDLASGESAIIPEDVDLFIHAGYIKNENGVDAFKLNLQGTSELLKACKQKKTKQVLFLSSLSADKNALSVYGQQKAAIEELFSKENGIVVRAGLVLGDGGLFGSMRKYLSVRNTIPIFGRGDQPLQTVYVDDLVTSIYQIVERSLVGTLVVATEESVPYKQFYSDLAETVGTKPKFKRLPFWFASFGISIAKLFRKKIPITKDNLLGLKQMHHISSASDLKKIGVKLRNHKESFLKLRSM